MLVEADQSNTGKAYCSLRFVLGFVFMILGTLIHVFALPFLDLSLIAVNACIGIIFSVLLSSVVLKEQFIPKYDLTGLSLILAGCILIVLNANKTEQEFTGEQAIDMLLSARSLIYIATCLAAVFITNLSLGKFLRNLRRFEADVDRYQNSPRT